MYTSFLSDIKTQSASPRRMPFLYIVNLASSFAETESQTLECTRRPRRRRRWRARRSTFGSSTRPRRTCAWRECTPVRRIDARKMSIVSRRHHRAHPRARSSSSTDRSFGRSTLRAPVARRLSRVFRAHRFVRAPERGSTRVNTASRDDARSLTSDDGGCGEHGASLEKCASSSEARARQTTTPVPLRPPSTRPKTRVDGRATVDGGRWTSRFSRARRSASKGVHSHSFIHSFIHSFVSRRFRRRRRSAAVVVSCRETPARDSSRSASRSSPSSRSVRSGSVDSWRDGWRCETR